MGERVSVIIPTKGRADQLREALLSLSWQTYPVHELILVDDSSADDYSQNERIVREFKAAHDGSFAIHHLKGRGIGAADARNQGAEASTGDILSFIDDDVLLDKDYYMHLVRSLNDPSVAGVTGVVTNTRIPSRKWLLFSKLFFQSTVSMRKGQMRRSGYPCYLLNAEVPVQVGVMSGCNMSLRREVFMRFLFDPALSGYSYLEDADLSFRVSKEHRLIMNPQCRLVHNSVDKAVSERYFTVKISYHRYIFHKNFSRHPVNYIPYAVSVIGDLMLIVLKAIEDGKRSYVSAALAGLSKANGPGRNA